MALDDRHNNGAVFPSPKPNRFGGAMSKHTTQRLNDLMARRAEMEDEIASQSSTSSSQSSFKSKGSRQQIKSNPSGRPSISPPPVPPTTPPTSPSIITQSSKTNGQTPQANGSMPYSTPTSGLTSTPRITAPTSTPRSAHNFITPAKPLYQEETKPSQSVTRSSELIATTTPRGNIFAKPQIDSNNIRPVISPKPSMMIKKDQIPCEINSNLNTRLSSFETRDGDKRLSPTSPPTSNSRPSFTPTSNKSDMRKNFFANDTATPPQSAAKINSFNGSNGNYQPKYNGSRDYSVKNTSNRPDTNNSVSSNTHSKYSKEGTAVNSSYQRSVAEPGFNSSVSISRINSQQNGYKSDSSDAMKGRPPSTCEPYELVGENAAPFSCTSAISLPKATPNGTVGFGSLPDQVHRKAVRRGFDFTIMVVGDSGLGKSTLIKSLFQNDELYDNRSEDGTSEKIAKTVEIDIKKLEIEEEGIRLRLTVVDTPGFNDAIDSTESWKSIENYIDAQFDHYFQDESGVSRKNIIDNRVHCCLYFISPYGHGLRPIDVKFMKKLHNKVNIVPVISKADILTKPELERIKLKVLKEINDNKIEIYSFPDDEDIEDSEQKMLRSTIPFAVIGADTIIEVAGKRIRGRRYPWGIVDVDNPEHCDFGKLRQMLISTHLQDLKDATRDLYENYRAKYIQEHVINMPINNKNSKVKCSESILAAKDTEIQRMQEQIEMMKSKLQNTSIGVNI